MSKLRTAPMENAAPTLPIHAKLFHLNPILFARQTDIFLTQTIARSFTSVSKEQPRISLAPAIWSTAMRRMLA
jgi:hypothetical protein